VECAERLSVVDSRRWSATTAIDGSTVFVVPACRRRSTETWRAFSRTAESFHGRAATAAYPHNYVPVSVDGDGNCMFRAISLACYGSQEYHGILRGLAAAEILQHPQWYDAHRIDTMHPLRCVPEIVLPEYNDVCVEVCTSGQPAGVTEVMALSAVIGFPIHTFWPPLSGLLTSEPLSRMFTGRGVSAGTRTVHLLWSTTGSVPKRGEVHINHLVPLLPKRVPVDNVSVTDVTGDDTKPAAVLVVSGIDDCDTVVAHGTKRHGDAGSDGAPASKSECCS